MSAAPQAAASWIPRSTRPEDGGDGVPRATIVLPKWHELPPGWDGPHSMDVAVPLADSYAHEFGYHAIAIDIDSSQLWQPEWGQLQRLHQDE